jgi:hypothetical protein
MEFEEIIELFNELAESKQSNQLEWISRGNTRFETNWNGQDIVIDRRNNIDIDSQEIYLKVAEFEISYLPESEEFESLVIILDAI